MSEGKFDEMKGRAKEAVGDLTDDDELKDKGKVEGHRLDQGQARQGKRRGQGRGEP
jgi:uncharacterized protein YjbJ (UPF0337 family)